MRPSSLPPACLPDRERRCSLCGDAGWVGEVLEIETGHPMGRVRMEDGEKAASARGRVRTVALDLVEGVEPGDRVVVHMGFAIARLREGP